MQFFLIFFYFFSRKTQMQSTIIIFHYTSVKKNDDASMCQKIRRRAREKESQWQKAVDHIAGVEADDGNRTATGNYRAQRNIIYKYYFLLLSSITAKCNKSLIRCKRQKRRWREKLRGKKVI